MLCRGCGLEKDPSLFYASNRASCKECVKLRARQNREDNYERVTAYDRNRPNQEDRKLKSIERVRVRRENGEGEILNRTKEKWANRHPEKRKAQWTLSNAVRDGKILKPDCCSHCSSKKRIQGHHWSYLPEHQLDVIWLCATCHGAEHRRLNELGRDPDKIGEIDAIC